jgi:hypothetical protein
MSTTARKSNREINELIERSSLGTPEAKALRHTVKSEVAAQLVAGAAARASRLATRPRKSRRR